MTNSYDSPERQQVSYPRDLDQEHKPRSMGEAADIRSRLSANLHASMEEAQNLANVYSNLARQLELSIVLVETKK